MSPEFIERRELNYVQGELGDGGRRINTLPTDNREAIQALKPNVTSQLLTPPPTPKRAHKMIESKAIQLVSSKPPFKSLPQWAVTLMEVAITLPLYLFSFWLMIEFIKAGGETLIATIDYLAFRHEA